MTVALRARETALVLAIALCIAIGLSAASLPAAVAAAATNGVVRYATLAEPETLNPLLGATVAVGNVSALVFDGLVRIGEDGRPVPDLATVVPSRDNGGISADGRTITYHLDPRARWHDGQPVTAEDVAFTWHAIMNPRNLVALRAGYEEITAAEVVDPHTVRFRLRRAYAPMLYLFTTISPGAILPKHVLGSYADLNHVPFNTAPIGSGPYRVREWRHGDRIVFERNTAYFRGAPSIERIDLEFTPDSNTLLNLVRTHEIDAAADLTPDQLEDARRTPGVSTTLVPINGFSILSFNTRRAPLSDVRVRQALCYAIDPKHIFNVVYHGVGLQAPVDQSPAGGWADPSLRYYPTDPARAASLLDAAGWKMGSDGYRSHAGNRLTLDVTAVSGNKTAEQVEVITQAAWRAIGVDARIKNAAANMVFAQSNGILTKGTFDVAFFAYFINPDPNDSAIVGPGTVPPQGENETGYVGDAAFARLQRDASGTYDLARRHALYNRLQAILLRDVPRYTLRWQSLILVTRTNLHGVSVNPAGDAFWNVQKWTLGPA